MASNSAGLGPWKPRERASADGMGKSTVAQEVTERHRVLTRDWQESDTDQKRSYDHNDRNWRDRAISQDMLAATR